MKLLFVSFVICMTTFVSFKTWSSEKPTKAYLDSHLHVFFNGFDDTAMTKLTSQFQEFLNSGRIQKALVLSPAYLADHRSKSFKLHLRELYNEKTADLVAKYPNHLLGLCGLNHMWGDGPEVIEKCLQRKEMIGIKLHIVDDNDVERLTVPSIYDNVIRSVEENRSQVRVILIHMPGTYAEASRWPQFHSKGETDQAFKRDVADLDKLVDIGKKFPEIQIVVAHSLNQWELVNELSQRIHSNKLKNFWLETSTYQLHRMNPETQYNDWKRYATSWRRFGMNRILFGSDQFLGNTKIVGPYDKGETFDKEFKSIQDNVFLNTQERDAITKHNGEELLSIICGKCQPEI